MALCSFCERWFPAVPCFLGSRSPLGAYCFVCCVVFVSLESRGFFAFPLVFLVFVVFLYFFSRTHFSSPAPGVPFARLDAGALATQPCVVFSTMCVLLFWFLGACDRAQGKPGTSQVCPVLTSQLCWSLARTRLRSRVRSSFLSADLRLQRRRPWREVHPKCLRSFSFVVCFSHPPWWVRAGVFLILLLLLGACPCGSFARLFTASCSCFPSGGVPVLLLYMCSLNLLVVFLISCSIPGDRPRLGFFFYRARPITCARHRAGGFPHSSLCQVF